MGFRTESYFSDGSIEIKNTRIWLAKFSIARAYSRMLKITSLRSSFWSPSRLKNHNSSNEINSTTELSEVADDRPITSCAFTNDGTHFITASVSGNLKVWSIPMFRQVLAIKAHNERITGVAVNPKINQKSSNNLIIATSSADRTARVWTFDGTLLSTLTGHYDSLTAIKFHPSGRLLSTSSLDQTWSLWDLEKTTNIVKTIRYQNKKKLYEQDGHHQPVYSISFQTDGSLLASAGSDTIIRLWDIRTGRYVMTLEGHIRAVLTLDFSADGFHIVSGSLDQSCQIWDLREAKCEYTIAAHKKLVKSVKCHPHEHNYFVSVGYDKEARIWSLKDYKLIRILAGHGDKVMGVDINPCSKINTISTICYDKIVRLWQN